MPEPDASLTCRVRESAGGTVVVVVVLVVVVLVVVVVVVVVVDVVVVVVGPATVKETGTEAFAPAVSVQEMVSL